MQRERRMSSFYSVNAPVLIILFQFAPRPSGFQCPYASNIQSYCDAADPYCCNGNDANTHQGYANKYGSAAVTFVKNKVNAKLGKN
jgi:acetylxylan esterase